MYEDNGCAAGSFIPVLLPPHADPADDGLPNSSRRGVSGLGPVCERPASPHQQPCYERSSAQQQQPLSRVTAQSTHPVRIYRMQLLAERSVDRRLPELRRRVARTTTAAYVSR